MSTWSRHRQFPKPVYYDIFGKNSKKKNTSGIRNRLEEIRRRRSTLSMSSSVGDSSLAPRRDEHTYRVQCFELGPGCRKNWIGRHFVNTHKSETERARKRGRCKANDRGGRCDGDGGWLLRRCRATRCMFQFVDCCRSAFDTLKLERQKNRRTVRQKPFFFLSSRSLRVRQLHKRTTQLCADASIDGALSSI